MTYFRGNLNSIYYPLFTFFYNSHLPFFKQTIHLQMSCLSYKIEYKLYLKHIIAFQFQIYFFLFTWITGSMTVGKIQPLFTDPEIYDDSPGGFDGRDANQIHHTNLHEDNHSNTINEHENLQQRHNIPNQRQQGHVMGRTSSVTSVPSSSNSEAGNESGLQTNTTKRMSASSPSHHSYNDIEDFELDRENNSVSMLRLFLFSDTYSMGKPSQNQAKL